MPFYWSNCSFTNFLWKFPIFVLKNKFQQQQSPSAKTSLGVKSSLKLFQSTINNPPKCKRSHSNHNSHATKTNIKKALDSEFTYNTKTIHATPSHSKVCLSLQESDGHPSFPSLLHLLPLFFLMFIQRRIEHVQPINFFENFQFDP